MQSPKPIMPQKPPTQKTPINLPTKPNPNQQNKTKNTNYSFTDCRDTLELIFVLSTRSRVMKHRERETPHATATLNRAPPLHAPHSSSGPQRADHQLAQMGVSSDSNGTGRIKQHEINLGHHTLRNAGHSSAHIYIYIAIDYIMYVSICFQFFLSFILICCSLICI